MCISKIKQFLNRTKKVTSVALSQDSIQSLIDLSIKISEVVELSVKILEDFKQLKTKGELYE